LDLILLLLKVIIFRLDDRHTAYMLTRQWYSYR